MRSLIFIVIVCIIVTAVYLILIKGKDLSIKRKISNISLINFIILILYLITKGVSIVEKFLGELHKGKLSTDTNVLLEIFVPYIILILCYTIHNKYKDID